ncbi:hypothetical protein BSL78_13158 [Apostichopus japonicus]|uniref:Uncharacterized protein n=1 Tax=Stichopus japonicus TaxID=307972 RepID=A0A2G8KPM2_STIJA|nr:hypothetical protein BSL78_13158 [Apostichopus japonicus]
MSQPQSSYPPAQQGAAPVQIGFVLDQQPGYGQMAAQPSAPPPYYQGQAAMAMPPQPNGAADQQAFTPWQPNQASDAGPSYQGDDIPDTDPEDNDDDEAPPSNLPPPDINSFEAPPGYEQSGAAAGAPLPPPAYQPPDEASRPMQTFTGVGTMNEQQVRDAICAFADKQCCYGTGAAERRFSKKGPKRGLHIIVECTRNGLRVRFAITVLDVALSAVLVVTVEEGFVVHLVMEAAIEPIIPKERRKEEHFSCHGSGKKRCGRCGGDGRITCPICEGFAKLRWYIQLKVQYINNVEDFIHEPSDLPDELIRDVSGKSVFEQTLPYVWPISQYEVPEINENSFRIVERHRNAWPESKLLQQISSLSLRFLPAGTLQEAPDGMASPSHQRSHRAPTLQP